MHVDACDEWRGPPTRFSIERFSESFNRRGWTAHYLPLDFAECLDRSLDISLTAAVASMSIAEIEPLVAACSPCALRPIALVVSWHGVLALAMEGWPCAMAALKDDLNERAATQWALRDENSGSRWPKITLACLRDGQQLSLVQLRSLHALAQSFTDRVSADPWHLEVRTLSAVVFDCRSLERLLSRRDMAMRRSDSIDAECSADSVRRVAAVRAELSDDTAEAYLPLVNADGGRLAHYTQPHTDATLVTFCTQSGAGSALPPSYLLDFQMAVDRLLPGCYHFFPWSSLHCTIRALTPQN